MTGADDLDKRLAALQSPRTRRVLLETLGHRAVFHAYARAAHKTGNMRRTIRMEPPTDDSVRIVAGGKDKVGYAADVEFGTRPHRIVPKPGRIGRNGKPAALGWGGSRRLSGSCRSGSKPTIFARSVNHPGTRARPFLRPGAQQALEDAGLAGVMIQTWNQAA